MKKNWLYAKYLARHKFYVFVAGRKFKVPLWRLIIHDWSKFMPVEWIAYREFFYGERTQVVKDAFRIAWLHHIHLNKHHWNRHFVLVSPFCKCYDQNTKWESVGQSRKLRNRANDAGKCGQLPTLSMEDESANCAQNITQATGASGGNQILSVTSESSRGTTKTMLNDASSTTAMRANETQNAEGKLLSIMEELLLSARAVEKLNTNFWHWITRTVAARNIERKCFSVPTEPRWPGGRSGTISQTYSECSATTAIRPMGTMDIALTKIVVDDGIYCLGCGTKGSINDVYPLPMPDKYVREMLADWWGAGRAIFGVWRADQWYEEKRDVIVLHPKTQAEVERRLTSVKF